MGFDIYGKTVGIIGTGKIGQAFAFIMQGLGCRVLAYDPDPQDELIKAGIEYVELSTLYQKSHIISLHCPLNPQTHHLIDDSAINQMRDNVMIINTSRGAIIDTQAVIDGLKSHKIGYLGLDVYEEEADLFFEDLSDQIITDDTFARLLTFPNVVVTGHQAFFTEEAMHNIAEVTLNNIQAFEHGHTVPNTLLPEKVMASS
jgi:D-lactate dehydrogenase